MARGVLGPGRGSAVQAHGSSPGSLPLQRPGPGSGLTASCGLVVFTPLGVDLSDDLRQYRSYTALLDTVHCNRGAVACVCIGRICRRLGYCTLPIWTAGPHGERKERRAASMARDSNAFHRPLPSFLATRQGDIATWRRPINLQNASSRLPSSQPMHVSCDAIRDRRGTKNDRYQVQ